MNTARAMRQRRSDVGRPGPVASWIVAAGASADSPGAGSGEGCCSISW
ncbi:MAG: hypothetical protein WD009_02645 [Phycisphaeraceae bacterium]